MSTRAKTEVIVTNRLGDWAAPWDLLVERMTNPSPYLRSWWLEANVEDASFILVVFGGVLLGGVAATMASIRGIERVQLIPKGALWPHGLDIVASNGNEDEVGQAVVDHLATRGRLGAVLNFSGTFRESVLVRSGPARARIEQIDEWMTLDVPADFEDYLAARPRHLRQEIRRIDRRLTERGVVFRTVSDPIGMGTALDEFERLHRLRWRDGGSSFVPLMAAFVLAARAGAERGEVVVHEVAHGERVLASLVTLELGTTCCFYQMGRDPDPEWSGTGVLLRARAIQRSCEVGHTKIDLGTGSPELKAQWADERHPVIRVTWGCRLGRAVFWWRAIRHPLAAALRRGPPGGGGSTRDVDAVEVADR